MAGGLADLGRVGRAVDAIGVARQVDPDTADRVVRPGGDAHPLALAEGQARGVVEIVGLGCHARHRQVAGRREVVAAADRRRIEADQGSGGVIGLDRLLGLVDLDPRDLGQGAVDQGGDQDGHPGAGEIHRGVQGLEQIFGHVEPLGDPFAGGREVRTLGGLGRQVLAGRGRAEGSADVGRGQDVFGHHGLGVGRGQGLDQGCVDGVAGPQSPGLTIGGDGLSDVLAVQAVDDPGREGRPVQQHLQPDHGGVGRRGRRLAVRRRRGRCRRDSSRLRARHRLFDLVGGEQARCGPNLCGCNRWIAAGLGTLGRIVGSARRQRQGGGHKQGEVEGTQAHENTRIRPDWPYQAVQRAMRSVVGTATAWARPSAVIAAQQA